MAVAGGAERDDASERKERVPYGVPALACVQYSTRTAVADLIESPKFTHQVALHVRSLLDTSP